MNTENLSTLKIHKLTQAQYNRELAAGNIDANALYLTPDENNQADYVIETNTTGAWEYKKWSNGYVEAWHAKYISVTPNTAWGSVYYASVTPIEYPSNLFIYEPLSIQANTDSGEVWVTVQGGTKTSTGNIYIISPTKITSAYNIHVEVYAYGRWK